MKNNKYYNENTFITEIIKDLKKQIKIEYRNISKKNIQEYKNLILNINNTKSLNIFFDFSFSNIEKAIKKILNKNIEFTCINVQNINFYKKVDFSNLTLTSKVNFSYSMFGSVDFSNTIFLNEVNFSFTMFNEKINFENIKFKNKANFSDSIFNGIFNICNTYFYNQVSFKRARFEKETIFESISFYKNVSFKFSQCKKSVNFISTIFYNNLDFSRSQFFGDIIFYNINIIKNNNSFSKVKIKKINFNSIKFFNNECFLSLINHKGNNRILLKSIDLRNIIINGKIELKNIEVKKSNFKGSIIDGGYINPVNFKVHKFANRESALFLKQQAYAKNNVIDALQYKAKEIEKHKEDLIKDWQKNKDFKTFGDIVSIGLSSLYSDNGQNWIRAFICTILFPTVFFTLSFAPYTVTLFILIILCFAYPMFHNNNITKYIFYSFITYLIISFLYMFNDNSHLNFIKELFSFLTPTNFNQIVYNNENPSYIHSNNTSYIQLIFKGISYFIGKIAFWYGSVQTVTAFRKFAKGA